MEKETLEKVIEIVGTHPEHEGGYCDTGSDMDWSCRSECTELAIQRLRSHFAPSH